MKWQMDSELHPSKLCDHYELPGRQDYLICVQGQQPLTRAITLKDLNKGINRLELVDDNFIIDKENPNIKHVGRQQLCKGDSGGGHWMTNLGKLGEPVRFVLVGISKRGNLACSGQVSQIQKTTYKDIINWIKEKVMDNLDDAPGISTTQSATILSVNKARNGNKGCVRAANGRIRWCN